MSRKLRRGAITIALALIMALLLAACGGVEVRSSAGNRQPTKVGSKATAKPKATAKQGDDEPTSEPEEDEPTERPSSGGTADFSEPCSFLTKDEVKEVLGEAVTATTPSSQPNSANCLYTANMQVVNYSIIDMGTKDTAKMGFEGAKTAYENAEDLDGLGDMAVLVDFAGVPTLQAVKGKYLVTLTYVSMSSTGDFEGSKDQMIQLAEMVIDRL